MSDSLKAGVIGVGLVGAPHIEAIKRTGLADVVAVAASSPESARRAAERHGVRRAVEDWRAIVEDPEIDVVHNCTPNHVHAEVGTAALAAGKHLITEKPLADTFEHAGALMTAAAQSPSVTALCHNYREYAMVAQARELIADGTIGDVFQVHGVYLQDWLSERGATNWRLSPEQSGPSTTFADIGTHWCDLAMHLLGAPDRGGLRRNRQPPRAHHRRPWRLPVSLRGRCARDARLLAGVARRQEQLPDQI